MDDTPIVTPDHYTAFGGIVHIFAKIEFMLQAVIAGVAQADLQIIMFMTADLNYRGKLDCALNVVKVQRPELAGDLEGILKRVHGKSGLRNNIAHSIWKRASRPGAIKPIGVRGRGGNPRLIGVPGSEKSWTVQELFSEAGELEQLFAELDAFVRDSGLASIIERKIFETISSSDDSNHTNPSSK